MKKLIFLLLAMPLIFSSCSQDEEYSAGETVQVNFYAQLPQELGTRASSTLSVDRVYCAVFEGENEIKNLRKTIEIVPDGEIVFSPRLIKGRTYNIVFWASKDGAYNVENMTAITRNTGVAEADFDAFTATTTVTVENSVGLNITLVRPIAQLNMGVTPEDWQGVAGSNTFNMLPKNIVLSFEGKDTFNALEGKAVGESKTLTYNLEVSGDEFTCKGNTYKNIAMCYVLAESEKQLVDLTYTISAEGNKIIRQDVGIPSVPLQRNYMTNVVGGLLTGTITYTINFGGAFLTGDDFNKEI